jgi:hypothetical protein
MNIVSPALFTLAALAAALTIWKSMTAALPAFSSLRAQLAQEEADRVIHVATLDTRMTRAEEQEARAARPRRRLLQPKPVTHRLHHFPHRAHAA